MAGTTIPSQTVALDDERLDSLSVRANINPLLKALASLKFTVVLFALAIVLVLIGTLAQAQDDIWQVMDDYFRTAIAWVPLKVLFPPSFFPGWEIPEGIRISDTVSLPLTFPFPGGWLIGGLMGINLLAAHGIRFKLQAKGSQRLAGFVLLAVGMFVTWLVIASGTNQAGFSIAPKLEWKTLWNLSLAGLGAAWLGTGYALFQVGTQRKLLCWALAIVNVSIGGLFLYYVFQPDAGFLGESEMRILWQLIKASFAGVVLLGGCLLLFKKRGGIVLLHWGIALLMFNELYVGLTNEEAQLTVSENQTANFVRDIREVEVAVIDPSGKETDDVVVIPKSMLKSGAKIKHEFLPFDIEVVKFLQNSNARKLKPGEKTPATAGVGLQWTVDEAKASTGADSNSSVDLTAAYLKFTDKKTDADLGTYLVGLFLSNVDFSDSVAAADGKAYDVAMRFKRTYKDYQVTLLDVRKDDYLGTDTPRNYSSNIHLVDKSRKVDREVKIWMNNPLRFAGETFYQSGYFQDPRTGTETTTLQVVSNPGWMIPYVCCMIVVIGMLAQFGMVLIRFMDRQSRPVAVAKAVEKTSSKTHDDGVLPPLEEPDKTWAGMAAQWFPVLIVGICALYLLRVSMPPRTAEGEMDLYAFGKLPLVFEGRVKPFDTLARNSLRIISNKQDFKDNNVKRQPAIRWLLDVAAGTDAAEEHRVFRIENLEVQQNLGLKPRKGYLYSLSELRPKAVEFNEQVDKAREVSRDKGAEHLSVFQRKVLELDKRVRRYTLLQASFVAAEFPRLPTEEEFKNNREAAMKTLMLTKEVLERARAASQTLSRMQPPRSVPTPQAEEASEDGWEPFSTAWVNHYMTVDLQREAGNPATAALKGIFDAYKAGDAKAFNRGVEDYNELLATDRPVDYRPAKVNAEAWFNHASPFYYSAALYILAFVLTALSWLGWTRPFNRAAFWLIVLLCGVQMAAVIMRMYISGRPPVTNLYSSAVFIGLAAALMGIVLELIFKIGVGNVIASTSGFVSLGIAHMLSNDGDTIGVLQAVLDTQFWLATHVVCITLGYATTFVAGMLGLVYVIWGVFTTTFTPQNSKTVSRMIYGTVCFALFFSFFGTVLGGLWADDSWGRFWGWDPKENGALIIVLWNALILHARWGGMVKDRGLAMLAIFGNIVTAWSWFGVNELGIGLHSYGFTDGVLKALAMFWVSQMAIILLGAIPRNKWRSAA